MSRTDNVRLLLGLYHHKLLSVEHEVLQRIPESKQRYQHTVSDIELDRSDYRMGSSTAYIINHDRSHKIAVHKPLRRICRLRTNIQSRAMRKYIIISTSNDLVRIAQDKVVYISSDGNYSTLIQSDGDARLITFQLGQVERLIADQLGSDGNAFIRIGKCLIVNRNYIYYINVSKQQLILSDNNNSKLTVSASKEALKQLKELLEREK